VILIALTISSRAWRISSLASFEAWFWYWWWFPWFRCSLSISLSISLELGPRFSPFWRRLSRAALAELGWGKGAASSSEEMGFVAKSNANWAPWLNRASGELVGRSSCSLGPSGSSPSSWKSMGGGLEPGGSGGAI